MSTDNPKTESQQSTTAISTDTARKKLDFRLHAAFTNRCDTLIDAPTSLGKTYTVATTEWRSHPDVTGDEPVVHLHATRENRDDAADESEQAGVESQTLKSGLDLCPVADGEFDDELSTVRGQTASAWLKSAVERRGYTFHQAHSALESQLDGLPCEAEDDGCPGSSRWQPIRDDDGSPTFDVVHATHEFARVDDLVENANVIFDERPSFGGKIDNRQHGTLHGAVNKILRGIDESMSWNELVRAVQRGDKDRLSDYHERLSGDDVEPTRGLTHRDARKIALAMSNAGEQIPDWRYVGRAEDTAVVLNQQGELDHVYHIPDLSAARCVVGLDAHPSLHLWRLNTVESLSPEEVLPPEERQRWRRERRGLRIIQVGTHTRPYTRGWRGSGKEKAKRIIDELRAEYGQEFRSCICSQSTKRDVERMLTDADVESPELLYFGNLRSKNTLADETIGLITASIDPGDERVLNWLALRNLQAIPEKDGGERAYGRAFIGPDGDAAAEFIEAVREDNLAQAVGRYARNLESDTSGATVYVWSAALPGFLTDETVPGITSQMPKSVEDVERHVRYNSPTTRRKTQEAVGLKKTRTVEILQDLAEQGIVSVSEGTGYNGAHEYRYEGGEARRNIDLGF